ncbi:MAG: HyaD/HybD family hydrogenase maturation endopeptidase [Chromatiaceae bacterium]|jgi:hydrogenase maturation protease|nr:HyaD/HybD family hydrogenase maturation endopeptidase [Chromatiaceae bacterium]
MSLLVVGLGNILLQDEGVGVRLVERLAEVYELPREVEALDGGTSGMELIHTIADRDALIVCDAVRSESPPGTVMRIPGEELPAFFSTKLSPHQLGLSDVLATLTLLERAPPSIVLIGIVPKNLDLGMQLSAHIESALEEALALLVEEIESLGYPLRRHPASAATIDSSHRPLALDRG